MSAQVCRLFAEALNAYETAFLGAEDIEAEINAGRWDGARAILEAGRQALEDAGCDWRTGEVIP